VDLDWNDLKFVRALARGGSLAAAARLLAVDNSTVSRRLAAIEEALGAQLLVRGGREFTWTEAGRVAIAVAERMAEHTEELGRAVRAAQSGIAGTVKISCTPPVAIRLAGVVQAARERYPELRVELHGQLAPADLGQGEADVALRAFKPDGADLIARRGIDVGWVVIASAAYAAQHGLPRDASELERHALVLYGSAFRQVPGPRWLEDRKGGCVNCARFDNPDAVTAAVSSGAGIGIAPAPAVHGLPGLVRVFAEPVAWGHLWIVYHQANRDRARIRAVVDLLVEHFASDAETYTAGGKRPAQPG
jgi:DNA-binding transcriptional LysR family regulator